MTVMSGRGEIKLGDQANVAVYVGGQQDMSNIRF